MTTTTTNATTTLDQARRAVKEAYRQLVGATHLLDLAGCEEGEQTERVYATRDAAGELRDLVCDLLDEVGGLAEAGE